MFGPSFWLGLIAVAAWASENFSVPFAKYEVRYSSSLGRYWFGRLFYIGTAGFAYIVVALIIIALIKLTNPSLIQIGNTGWKTQGGWFVSICTIICLSTLLYIPICTKSIDFIRRVAQNVALFPYELNSLITVVSRSPFRPLKEAEEKIIRELCRYGAVRSSIDTIIAQPAIRVLVELYSLQRRTRKLLSVKRFAAYRSANVEAFDELDNSYRALLRRLGGLLSLDANSKEANHASAKQVNELSLVTSELASETAIKIIMRYRRILAQLAVSQYLNSKDRSDLWHNAGYSRVETSLLPLWSLAGLYFGFWILFIALMVTIRVGVGTGAISPSLATGPVTAGNLIVIVTGLAGSQMLAILFAILPKLNAVKISCSTQRRLSYWIYSIQGLCSYLTGVILSLLILLGSFDGPLGDLPWQGAFIFSLMNIGTTVGASVIIDLRLGQSSYDYHNFLLRDAIILGLSLSFTNVVVQLLADTLGVPHTWAFVGLWMGVGLMVGYLLPSSAAAQLTALEADIVSDVSGGTLVKEITERANLPRRLA